MPLRGYFCYTKTMKVFIASPWRNQEKVLALSEELIKRGHEVHSFLESGSNLATGMSIGEELRTFGAALQNWQNDPKIKSIFDSELQGLKNSDMVILLQPAGHSSLIEAGIGYGIGKRVVAIGPTEKPEVFYLICERIYPDIASFLKEFGS
jgi:hypothetical protein